MGQAYDRREMLLEGLNLSVTRGLEIGALHNPVLRRPQADVLYVDHVGTPALVEKYRDDPGIDPARIVPVDIVWSGGPLGDACAGVRFDYVVASHVIEHVPDLVGWLGQLKSVLHPNGTIRLIVPDRRYCFDYRRETSSVADLILAARAGASIPGARQILDFRLNIAALDLTQAWRRGAWSARALPDPPPDRSGYEQAIAVMQDAAAHGTYHDVHCWVFTPLAFARLMRQLAAYGLLGFACTRCTATEPDSLDFFVHLMATDDETLIRDSWAWAVEQNAVPEDAEAGRLRVELAALRASRSWRWTALFRRLGRKLAR